ncbi:endonuclease I [Mesorhizobium sp. LNJC384A00]|uniref:endonuclease I n=1 Tax=Mesorhizobium sp. LNJC384A00 TaxID=1287268 RepID=UPI0003CE8B60|nr:endonuclease I [Mesorhizobium sp. LNJC384A00]ESY41894.1 endonuclease I [Mesorhizobium sp. LNJC384A00]
MARRTTTTTPTSDPRRRAILHGYRSGLEERIAAELADKGIKVTFEGAKVFYTPPLKLRSYTPDFPLPNGIVVETKGRFDTDDRQKHKVIKAEHPDLDIRFVFASEGKPRVDGTRKPRAGSKTKLSKGSPTTYANWCDQYGFLYADISIPDAWLNEPPCPKRIAALDAAGIKPAPDKKSKKPKA